MNKKTKPLLLKVVTFKEETNNEHILSTHIPWSPEEVNSNPLQYSCLGNPIDREAWRATVPGVTKESDTT